MIRQYIIVSGQVQGVGFRPFVYRLAMAWGLTGHVGNTPQGVRIEIQGTPEHMAAFAKDFQTQLPPLARISRIEQGPLPTVLQETAFSILHSHEGEHQGHGVLVSPDVALCSQCLQEILSPHNRRYGYAFTNCTDCGPRYTITRSIPYDRPVTSMACFPLCEQCAQEYGDPLNRRFHAQPNACARCGPHIWLETHPLHEDSPPSPTLRNGPALLAALNGLMQGNIAAIKGLGGFHLTCDAFNVNAIATLRQRKHRPHKALAVMVRDLEAARAMALISPQAEAALQSPQCPIVICPRLPHVLPDLLAPDTQDIGLMLPYTPLHHLLFHPQVVGGDPAQAPRALVMTSGNVGGEPICLGNREAKERLKDIADIFLLHNRDILVRADDSVLFPGGAWPASEEASWAPAITFRRARGLVPTPQLLPGSRSLDSVLAVGAELKHTFCLTRQKEAFVSQHIGTLSNAGALAFFEECLNHLEQLLEVRPQAVIRDLHPDYISSQLGEAYAAQRGVPVHTLQHHKAHIHAVLAEHAITSPCLGLALDGTGLGEDGTIWGGELFVVENPCHAGTRLGHLRQFALPGGEAAIREPWRIAHSLWQRTGAPSCTMPWLQDSQKATLVPLLEQMERQNINTPLTSSCGRLFDAVAAACGLCMETSYEGQAAIILEAAQDWSEQGFYPCPVQAPQAEAEPMFILDIWMLFQGVLGDIAHNIPVGRISRRFHRGLSLGLAHWLGTVAAHTNIPVVALGGGVFNNRTIATELPLLLHKQGIQPLLAKNFPPGDGAISLGQANWGSMLLASTN